MGTEKRARQKANRRDRLDQQKSEAERQSFERKTRRIGFWVALVAVLVGIVMLFNYLTRDDEPTNTIDFSATAEPQTTAQAPQSTAEVALASQVPTSFAPFAGSGALSLVEPSARNSAYSEAPPMNIDPELSYAAVLDTDAGTIRLELFAAQAPMTVNNFVNLARDGFYDGTTFHRVIEGFMAQGGDPTGTGTGGPGYQFADEFDNDLEFDKPGVLAMANAGPATNGSQFFITFTPQLGLNSKHTIFGQLVGDDTVLSKILRRAPGSGEPATMIRSVNIFEG